MTAVEVGGEGTFVWKFFGTFGAGKSLKVVWIWMAIFLVGLKVLQSDKSFVTFFAFKGSLPSVPSLVVDDFSDEFKMKITKFTGEALLGGVDITVMLEEGTLTDDFKGAEMTLESGEWFSGFFVEFWGMMRLVVGGD